MDYAPIVLFTYSRLKNTKETIDSLLMNSEAKDTELFIYSDAAKNESAREKVVEVRDFIHTVSGFKNITIIERENNWGLANNIINGVTEIVNKYGKVIVLEDDHSVSPFFLKYMNEGLERYENRDDIVSIHGYVYPHINNLPEAFLIKGADCWSWATWKRAWDLFNPDAKFLYNEIKRRKLQREFEFNYSYPYMTMLKGQAKGKANSWAICWYASTFLQNKYTLYPNESLTMINSLEDAGTHSSKPSESLLKYRVQLKLTPVDWTKVEDKEESKKGRKEFELFFLSIKSRIRRLFEEIVSLFK